MALKLPKAALTSVVLLLLLDVIFLASTEPLTGIPLLQPTGDDATFAAKRRLQDSTGAGAAVLVGDSSCLRGLDPAVMTPLIGKPVRNLCTLSSATVVAFVDMALELLADDARRPSTIVVSVLPQSLEMSARMGRSFDTVGRYLVAYGRSTPDYELRPADYWSWYVRKHRFNLFPAKWGGSYTTFESDLLRLDGFLPERPGVYVAPRRARGQARVSTGRFLSTTLVAACARRA